HELVHDLLGRVTRGQVRVDALAEVSKIRHRSLPSVERLQATEYGGRSARSLVGGHGLRGHATHELAAVHVIRGPGEAETDDEIDGAFLHRITSRADSRGTARMVPLRTRGRRRAACPSSDSR